MSLAATAPDALRLLALPVFAWVALADVRTRRVPRSVWIPLALLGVITLAWDGLRAAEAGGIVWRYEFLVPAAISVGIVVPLAYLFWWIGGFGAADAKALLVLAILFPVVPAYTLGGVTLPAVSGPHGAFAFVILVNAVLLGALLPVVLTLGNGVRGRFSAKMPVAYPVATERVPELHGKLLTPGGSVFGGVDLDAVRMYLRWRGLSLEELCARPEHFRDPATLPAEPHPPTDGRVGPIGDGGTVTDDPWGAQTFLEDIEGTAYGTTPTALRNGLDALASSESVWISPGMPFLVFVFGGLLLALGYGDIVAAVLA